MTPARGVEKSPASEDRADPTGPRGPWPADSDAVHHHLGAARSGDRAAFARLHAAYARLVHGVLLAHGAGPETDDLTQEVFMHAMRSISTLRDDASFPAWLAAIARNAARSEARGRRSRERIITTRHQHEAIDAQVGRDLDDRNDRTSAASRSHGEDATTHQPSASAVMAAIGRLPDAYRETLVLRLVEGLTGPQIAASLGLTHGSVRVNLSRGMKLLREELAREAHP